MVMNDPVAGDIPMYAVAVSGNGLSPLLHPERLSPQADFIPRYLPPRTFLCLSYETAFFYDKARAREREANARERWRSGVAFYLLLWSTISERIEVK